MSAMPLPTPADRILVVGTTGSGKTAMARRLAELLGVPHIELDALFWGPNWTGSPRDVFRQRVADAAAGDAWVACGNYSSARDVLWSRATFVVWLDYPLPVILWRLLQRTARRVLRREELWHGNRERFANAFLSRNSLFVWALRTFGRRRREYPALLRLHPHVAAIRLRSPRQADAWLARPSENPSARAQR